LSIRKIATMKKIFADKPWVTKTPYQIRDAALNDVVKAYTSNLAKENNNNFTIHFKKKKAPSDSIAIYATNYKSKGVIFPTFFGKEPIKSAEKPPDKLEYDFRLVKKRLGHFYLCIPKKLDKYNGPSQNKVIAFDPGMRTFCTGYDPDGIIVEVGKSDISRIDKLCYHYGCRINGPNRRSTIGRDTATKKQEQGCNFEFEIWLMNSTKKKQNGSAKITVLYSYPNLRLRKWFLNVRRKPTQRLLNAYLESLQIQDAIDEQG
jgi:hypothetical protein